MTAIARWSLFKSGRQLAQLLYQKKEGRSGKRGNAVHLKHVLGDIQTDGARA
ncbi:hypothetical protein [Mesorhizobium sp. M1121]|uniref:hypothetical protein n=1 Tax=Mesorhizobium sp. M1121 TaxID=2957058 RepID=UPI00333B04F7